MGSYTNQKKQINRFFENSKFSLLKKGLLLFIPQPIACFVHCPLEFNIEQLHHLQLHAMFFLQRRYNFLDRKACALYVIEGKSVFFAISEGKRVIFILKPQIAALLSRVNYSSSIGASEAPSRSPRIPKKLMQV